MRLVKGGKKHVTTSRIEEQLARHSMRKKVSLLIVLVIILLLMVAGVFVFEKYKIRTVYVEGNTHYTDEEIEDMVLKGTLTKNSIYLSILYRNKEIKGIPFIETMDVSILTADTIKITVYEKALAGYIEFLGQYMYFDKDGIIVESSSERTVGIPQVTGLKYGYVVLYEKLPVEDDSIFKQILSITQLLNKYEISTDKIYFDDALNMTLYFGEAKVMIGSQDYLDEKIMKLKYILPELNGKKGTLRMENYSEDMKNITFQLE
ncbi:MAG: FtsQ-type POTRA domain-containing protein [Lachnospiraceae bacterium]|nr:FtsQ-type POTRA domain-containing protein [Lachnospiraceae bacterium]